GRRDQAAGRRGERPAESPNGARRPAARTASVYRPRTAAGRHDGKVVHQDEVAPPVKLGPQQRAGASVVGRSDEARRGEVGQRPPVFVHAASSRPSRSRSASDTGASGGRHGPPYRPTASIAALTPAGPNLPTISRSTGSSR